MTFGQGVDIGEQGNGGKGSLFASAFGSDWANNPNLAFLGTADGRPSADSATILQSKPSKTIGGNLYSTSVSLTTEQANAATKYSETYFYNQLAADYDAAAKLAKTGGWSTLSGNAQTAMLDIAYNIGLQRNPPKHYGLEDIKSLWPLLVKKNFAAAAKRIKTLGMAEARRNEDAALITKPDATAMASAGATPATGAQRTATAHSSSLAEMLFDAALGHGGVADHVHAAASGHAGNDVASSLFASALHHA